MVNFVSSFINEGFESENELDLAVLASNDNDDATVEMQDKVITDSFVGDFQEKNFEDETMHEDVEKGRVRAKELEIKNKEIEELKNKIEELQKVVSEKEKNERLISVKQKTKDLLDQMGVFDSEALMNYVDFEKIELDDACEIKNFDSVVERLKKLKPHFFREERLAGDDRHMASGNFALPTAQNNNAKIIQDFISSNYSDF